MQNVMDDPVMNYKTSWRLWAYIMTSRRHFPRILTYTHHSLRTFGARNLISSRAQLFCFFVCLFVFLFVFVVSCNRLQAENRETTNTPSFMLVTGGFPALRASNAESLFMWWHYLDKCLICEFRSFRHVLQLSLSGSFQCRVILFMLSMNNKKRHPDER